MAIFYHYFDEFTVRQTTKGWQRQEKGFSDWSQTFATRRQAIECRRGERVRWAGTLDWRSGLGPRVYKSWTEITKLGAALEKVVDILIEEVKCEQLVNVEVRDGRLVKCPQTNCP